MPRRRPIRASARFERAVLVTATRAVHPHVRFFAVDLAPAVLAGDIGTGGHDAPAAHNLVKLRFCQLRAALIHESAYLFKGNGLLRGFRISYDASFRSYTDKRTC